jgi:hypothetical protein
MYQDVSGCIRMYQDVSGCIRLYQDLLEIKKTAQVINNFGLIFVMKLLQ